MWGSGFGKYLNLIHQINVIYKKTLFSSFNQHYIQTCLQSPMGQKELKYLLYGDIQLGQKSDSKKI